MTERKQKKEVDNMNELKESTEVTLSATMTVNGREVPMTATVDLLEFRKADAEAMHHGETVITSQHLDAALNDVTDQFKRALENHRSSTPPPTASSIGGWE
jgi:hypothetical protein